MRAHLVGGAAADPATQPADRRWTPSLDVEAVRHIFDTGRAGTVGIEEEVLLVDPHTMLPAPAATEVVEAAADARIKTELPACQIELVTSPHPDVAGAIDELRGARARLLEVCGAVGVRPIAAAVHPLVAGTDAVAPTARARALHEAYGEVAGRQLVGALQVHVAVGDADRALAVYNSLRSHLPELAALAAAAPFHEGRDTGFASVRPLIASQLPRQGVPPTIPSWEVYVDDLCWGAASGSVPEPRHWWWELRPHVLHGTLEVRVPDVQPTLAAAGAVAATVHALVAHLSSRHDDGELLPVAPTWRIAENRWAALRDGTTGEFADLRSGTTVPTAQHLHALLDSVEADAPDRLDDARSLIFGGTAEALRRVGVQNAVPWLADAFAAGVGPPRR